MCRPLYRYRYWGNCNLLLKFWHPPRISFCTRSCLHWHREGPRVTVQLPPSSYGHPPGHVSVLQQAPAVRVTATVPPAVMVTGDAPVAVTVPAVLTSVATGPPAITVPLAVTITVTVTAPPAVFWRNLRPITALLRLGTIGHEQCKPPYRLYLLQSLINVFCIPFIFVLPAFKFNLKNKLNIICLF